MSFITGGGAFPKFDLFHAHCAMKVDFIDQSCQDLYNVMKDRVMMWHPEPEAKGTYKVWDATELESLWATRTVPSGKYTDDILFDFLPVDPNDFQIKKCTIAAKSRSQSLSYYDYETNYCNMWNVIKETVADHNDLPTIQTSDCKWIPKDPATRCQTY